MQKYRRGYDLTTHSYYTGESTEKLFTDWCRRNNIWRKKIRVPLELDNEGINKANPQPCDFIAITPEQVKFIEIKEIWDKPSFPKQRFHQQYQLHKLSTINSHAMGYILLNFVERKKLFYLSILDYNKIYASIKKKSINIKDFPKKFETTWKGLKL